jgi:hypothetical protein
MNILLGCSDQPDKSPTSTVLEGRRVLNNDGKVRYGVETSPARTMRWKCVPDRRSEQDNHENFLPTVFCPVGHAGVNGDATGAAFFLFLSALGFFFFSRLLLNWPFAISSTLLL